MGIRWVTVWLLGASACGPPATAPTVPPRPTGPVGSCADIERGGVVSETPSLRRADRDLNGDGRDEIVVADRTLCRGPGAVNCHWNVFVADGACQRYVGTVDGAAIEVGAAGDRGFPQLRSWWRLSAANRALLHVYEFGGTGYLLRETLVCRSGGRTDQLQCASEDAL